MSENAPKVANVEIVNENRGEINPRDRLLKVADQKPKTKEELAAIRNNWMTPF